MKKRPSSATPATGVKKRPVRPVQYEDLTSSADQPMVQPEWAQAGPGPLPEHPAWAEHLVHMLLQQGLLPRIPSMTECKLRVWSDCSGINSEMFALEAISKALVEILGIHLRVSMYCSCDLDKECLRLTQMRYRPQHLCSNIVERNFQLGQFYCMLAEKNITLPREGIDLYVGTYPCSPWSRRGKRSGWDHPDIIPLHIGIQTVEYMRPATFVFELGELPAQAAREEIQQKIAELLNKAGSPMYVMQTVSGLNPGFSGYPIHRPRLFVLGWRMDNGTPDTMTAPLQCLLAKPMEIQKTFLGFLHLRRTADWSRVGEYPTDEELRWCMHSQCMCSPDAFVVCPVHKCKCQNCGDDGLGCSWRKLMGDLLPKIGPRAMVAKDPRRLTYTQVLEMSGGTCPENPRLRTYMNLMALHQHAWPLNDTLMIVDLSQNPPYQGTCHSGYVPTLATSSTPFCFQTGAFLTTYQLATLMGMQLKSINLNGFGERWFRMKIGLSVHPANFGIVLMALIAAPLAKHVGSLPTPCTTAGV